MATLAELMQTASWPEVKASLGWLSAENVDLLPEYRTVFRKLRGTVPVRSSMRICVQAANRISEEDPPIQEVVGKNGTLNQELEDFEYLGKSADSSYANEETAYSLALEPWEQWLGMEIEVESLQRWSVAQIVAFCLDEMTFHGFDEQQVRNVKDDLIRRVAELDAMTEEERKQNLVPAEKVFERLKKKLAEINKG